MVGTSSRGPAASIAPPFDRPAHALEGAAPDVRSWPDAWLVAAVRAEPPDAAALDALVARHWAGLFARCRMLAVSDDAARDLAQDTWVRVLRARHALQPDGNVPGYLATIATNLWRDRRRADRRAGALAEHRLASIDVPFVTASGDAVALADAIPDHDALARDEQAELRLDIDRALARLSTRARDVLVARYLDGETAAEIGRRYGRTEQTITSWLRQAVDELRRQLGDRGARELGGSVA